MSGEKIGMIVGAAFGCAWGIAGAVTLPAPWRHLLIAASLAITTWLVYATFGASLAPSHFKPVPYSIAVSLESIAIVVAAFALGRTGNASYIPPAIAGIVGLHFLGLWLATGLRVFVWTCIGLCAIAAAAALSPSAMRLGVSGIGSALVLWGAVAVRLVH